MGKVISFYVQKGGSGKTTTAGHIGYELSQLGRTLMIDADASQGNLTSWIKPEDVVMSYDLGDCFYKNASPKEAIVNIRPNLDLIGTFSSGGDLKQFIENQLSDKPYAVMDFMDEITKLGYSYVLFDLGPQFDKFQKMILQCSDEIIPVLKAEYFSVDGLEIFTKTLAEHRQTYRANYRADRLVINAIDGRYNIHMAYVNSLKATAFQIFEITQSSKVAETISFHKFVQEYDKENCNNKVYRELAQTVGV